MGILVKAVLVFLVAMVALAVFGRLKQRGQRTAFCPSCGRPRIGAGPCSCGKR